MADRSVGGIVGYLKLDKSDWDTELNLAGAKADELSRKNPNVKVTASTGEALAQLEAVALATGKLQAAQAKVSVAQQKYNDVIGRSDVTDKQYLTTKNALLKASRDEETAQIRLAAAYQKVDDAASKAAKDAEKNKSFSASPLAIGAAVLGPAAVPLAAVGAGALAGLVPLAATAILAFKGIQAQMAAGTATGTAYTQGVDQVKSSLQTLEATAASGVLSGFKDDVDILNGSLPTLNGTVAQLAPLLGETSSFLLDGVISGIRVANPLITDMAGDVDDLAGRFDAWTNNGGLQRLIAYIQTELPQVEHTLSELGTTVSHLVQAFAPLGAGSLTEIGLLSRAINAIPVSVLQVLVPLVTDGYLAFKAYEGLSSVGVTLDKVATSLRGVAAAEGEAAAAAEGADLSMSALLGPVGAVVTGVGLLAATFLGSSHNNEAATEAVDAYTQALKDDNGAIGDNVKAQLASNLSQSNALANAKALGISTQDLTDAILNGGAPLDAMKAKLEAIVTSGTHLHQTITPTTKAAQDLLNVLDAQSGDVATSVNQYQAYQAVLNSVNNATSVSVTSTQALANAYKYLLSDGASTANTAAQGLITAMNTYSTSAGTAADKAALLGAVLVASQGDALSYAGAVSSGYAATQALISTFAATEKAAIDLNTGLINLKAQGAAPLVQQLQAMQTAAEQAAEATYQHEVAQKGDNQALSDAQTIFESMTGGALVANAKQLGLTADQAQNLANQYFSFDGKTVTTSVQSIGLSTINDTLNQIGELLAKLTGQTWQIPVDVDVSKSAITTAGKGNATAGMHAAGGYLSEGWNTAGEGSATELMFKQGSSVQVLTHQQSLPMLNTGVASPSQPQTQVIHLTSYTQFDGKTIATTTNEYNLQAARRR